MLINPIWFYFIGLVGNLKFVLIVVVGVGFMSALYMAVYMAEACSFKEAKEEGLFKWLNRIVAIVIVATTLSVILPSKETLTKMLIAAQVTHENIDSGTEAVKEAVDYIFEKIDSLD